jgi:hypothetical protein
VRKYGDDEERAIRAERIVREWTRSGLLEQAQGDRILPQFKVELRRTNLFLRLIMFGFGLLIIGAAVALAGITFKIHNDVPLAMFCLFTGAGCFVLTEFLIANFRLYRFGVEEAAAVAGGILVSLSAAVFASPYHSIAAGQMEIFVAAVAGAAAGFFVYARFGYLYAAIAAIASMSAAPFAIDAPPATHRAVSAGLMLAVFIIARRQRRKLNDEFPGDDYGMIQATAWVGVYAYVNLQLESVESLFRYTTITGRFYWFTFVVIWLLPPIGVVLAIRDRDRPLLDASIVLALVTLATNKPYLGGARQSWDPIVFGVVLIGIAVALRRWLSTKDRNGFTAGRILISEKRGISAVGTASVLLRTVPPGADTNSPRPFEGEGGRSGGAGASGSF